jgi:hypothetical protein
VEETDQDDEAEETEQLDADIKRLEQAMPPRIRLGEQ